MLVTHRLTLGQITFILRVAIQILSYGGLLLIGIIVLATIPRIASAETHSVINRIVGKSTATKSSVKWVYRYLRGKSGDPVVSIPFLVAMILLVVYSLFVSISDIGFIGFYACAIAGPPTVDFPGSISTEALARAAIMSNLVNGTDPATVNVYRCDSSSMVQYNVNVTEQVCTAWHNSTYADPAVFEGLNSTDSDALMLRSMKHLNQTTSQTIDLNSFYISPGAQRVVHPTISNGLAVIPHPTGVRAIIGVPQLSPQHQVTLNKTMAVETDVGCMPLGIYAQHDLDAGGLGLDIYATNSSWRNYTGPDYLRDVLSGYVDEIRKVYLPFYNASTLDSDGFMFGINETDATLVRNAAIQSFSLPSLDDDIDSTIYMLGNCTNAVRQLLNITVTDDTDPTYACSLLAIAGSTTSEGDELEGYSRMLCASATQVNMVSATVEMALDGSLSVDLTRHPSDLNYLWASYWDVMDDGNDTIWMQFVPIERFTLADNPSGPTSHFIPFNDPYLNIRATGPGSGGNAISRLAPTMINANNDMDFDTDYDGLKILDEGSNKINFSSSFVTRWGGQVGASFILSSMAYNGWAALNHPMTVQSTGGQIATCYKPSFAIAFLPLIFAAVFVVGWALHMVLASGVSGYKRLETSYGGLTPYLDNVFPAHKPNEALLGWQNDSKPRLEVMSKEQNSPLSGASVTALGHFKASQHP